MRFFVIDISRTKVIVYKFVIQLFLITKTSVGAYEPTNNQT